MWCFFGLFTCSIVSIAVTAFSNTYENKYKTIKVGASLVAQWLGVHLPMQGTWVRALVREDPTCGGATKPVCHNY